MPKKKSLNSRQRSALNVALLRSFRIVFGSVREHFRQVRQSCGVSGSQVWMLHEIRRCEGIGVSELAARLSIHQSTCSLLVNKLVLGKHVVKAKWPHDQRRVGLALTKRGLQTLRQAPGPPEGVLPEAVAALTGAEARALYKGLRAVIAELDLTDEHAADVPLSNL